MDFRCSGDRDWTALSLSTSVPRHKPHQKLGNEANPFSQKAIPFLSLTRHATKQIASYLNSAVETAGDANEHIYTEDRYIERLQLTSSLLRNHFRMAKSPSSSCACVVSREGVPGVAG